MRGAGRYESNARPRDCLLLQRQQQQAQQHNNSSSSSSSSKTAPARRALVFVTSTVTPCLRVRSVHHQRRCNLVTTAAAAAHFQVQLLLEPNTHRRAYLITRRLRRNSCIMLPPLQLATPSGFQVNHTPSGNLVLPSITSYEYPMVL